MPESASFHEKRLRDWESTLEPDRTVPKKKKGPKSDRGSLQRLGRTDRKKNENLHVAQKFQYRENLVQEAVKGVSQIEKWLLPSTPGYIEAEEGEATHRYTQREILEEVEIGAAKKAFDLKLNQLGPYKIDFTRNGRYILLGGRKGHLAEFDWHTGKLATETYVQETIRDVQFLHNHMFWAAAQRQFVYIYNQAGEELHCLRDHQRAYCLEFLPYHFLLCSTGDRGVICWQDTTTGQMASRTKTRKGASRVMRQNPWNAVLCVGHDLGSVTMWTPSQRDPVVKMLCHKGSITSMAIDQSGNYLVTSGIERRIKVWDIRKFDELHSFATRGVTHCMDISQRGMLAVGHHDQIEVWKDPFTEQDSGPYLRHKVFLGSVEKIRFCPFEDVLGLGHASGVSTMLVPGAGEPNYDSLVANPFQTKDGRRELEVHQVLDKIQPHMIMLDPTTVGKVKPKSMHFSTRAEMDGNDGNATSQDNNALKLSEKKKTRMKGKNRPTRVKEKKEASKMREKTLKGHQNRQHEQSKDRNPSGLEGADIPTGVPFALQRFYR